MNTSDSLFNDRLRQLLMLMLLLTLFVLFLTQLSFLAPGFLGAVTLYILSRDYYTTLTETRKWKKGAAAALFLMLFAIGIGLPVYCSLQLLIPRMKGFFVDSVGFMKKVESLSDSVQRYTGFDFMTPETTKELVAKLEHMIPDLLNSSTLMLENFALILFLGYFMLTEGKQMEKRITDFIPLKISDIDLLGKETSHLVKANAIGIPLISAIQGVFATLGYWIFGVNDPIFWGFLTGIFAFFPIIGTSLIWIPICIGLFITHPGWQPIGLLLYSLIVTGNVDYLARITLLKRIGHVHPVTTIIGVILGLKLFGFWGFIFGPLLISYLLLLLKIYGSEFGTMYRRNKT